METCCVFSLFVFQSLLKAVREMPPSPLQHVAGVDAAPVALVVAAQNAHTGARTPAAVRRALLVASVISQS